MTVSFAYFMLVAAFVLSLFLCVINCSLWYFRKKDVAPLWLAVWLGTSAIFALTRLLQYATLGQDAILLLPRILLTSAYLLAWWGYEIANHFMERRAPRWERGLVITVIAGLLITLWMGDMILTDQILVRRIPFGGEFYGVAAGPLYLQAGILDLLIGAIPLVHLLRAKNVNKPGVHALALGYGFIILFSLMDFMSLAFHLNWIRFSDFSYLPMAVFFTAIQVRQIGQLYRGMEVRIQDRTVELRQANETLRASEEQAQLSQRRLMGLVNSAMDAVITVNGEQGIVLFNPAAEKMFGYRAEEVLGQPLGLILPERYRAQHAQQVDYFAETGITSRSMAGYAEVSGRKKDGSEFLLDASISQVDVGEEKLLTAILRDTSDRKHAEIALRESEEKYRTLVENAHDGITIIQRGVVRYVNPRLSQMRGEPIEDILGQRFDKYIHPEEKRKVIKHYRQRLAGNTEPVVYETILLQKSNFGRPVELASGFISYQGEQAEIVIVRDIYERKLSERALHRQLMEMMALNAVATAGAEATTIDELIGRVTDAIGNMLYPDNFGVLIADHERRTWRPHFSYQGTTTAMMEGTYVFSEGVAGCVISSGKLVRLSNVQQANAYMEVTSGIQSEIAVPIFVNGKIFGCINAESRELNFFSEHDEGFMSTVSGSMATAIEKIQLLQTEKRRRREAEVLYDTTRDLIMERDLSRLLQIIVERAVGMVGAPSGGLYLCDPERREVRCVVSYRTPRDYVGTILKYGEGSAGLVAETGEPLIIEDYRDWESRATVYEEDRPFVSVMSVPMRWQERTIGVIHILENSKPRSFTEGDLQVARHFANQAAIAVENARLFEREKHRRHEAEILRESMLSLTYSMGPETLFDVVLDTLLKLIPYDSASIELLKENHMLIAAGRNIPDRLIGTRYMSSLNKWGSIDGLRSPVIIADVQTDDRFVKLEGAEYIHGWMGIPMVARDKLIGFLNLDSQTAGFYTEAHRSIAQLFGSQAAIAIENMLLFQETTRHAQEASAIAEIGRDISGTLQLDGVLEKISQYAKTLLGADVSAVYLSNPDRSLLQAIVAMGPDAEQVKQDPIKIGEGILGNIALQQEGEIVNNTSEDPRAITIEGTGKISFEHLMGVPVLSKDQLIGLISVWRIGEGKEFNATDLNFLGNLAQQVAVAIENARLFDTEQKRRQEADTLREAAEKITSTLNQEQVIQWIMDQLAKVVNFKSASVQLLREGYLELVGGRGWVDTTNVLNACFAVPGDNPNTVVVRERRAVILDNAPGAYAIFNLPPHHYIKSWLGVPLIVRDRVIGMFAVDHDQPDFFTDADARLVSAFASQAAIAIENARLFEEQERRLREIEAVHTVSTALRSAQTLDEALPIILEQLMHLLRANGASLEMVDSESGEMVTELALGVWSHVTRLRTPAGWGLSSHVIATGEPYVSTDADTKTQRFNLFGGLNAVACVPVIAQNQSIGALWVGRQTPIRAEEVSLIAAIGEMVGNAIQRMRLHEQTIRRADEFEALFRTAQGFTSQWELRTLLETVVTQAMGLLHASGGGIYLYDAERDDLEIVVARGAVMTIGSRLDRGEGMAGRVLETHQHLIVDDYRKWQGHSHKYDYLSLGSVIEIPIIYAGELIGVLVVYESGDSNRKFIEADARLLSLFAAQAASAISTARLVDDLQKAYDTTLEGWARALELRDKETHGHARRVTDLTLRLARLMKISNTELIHVRRGVLLHDIGKMGIPDTMLRKDGPLTEEEWVEMRKHPQYAYDLLFPIDYLRPALDIPHSHHEKWDGSGYPDGLKGEQIPLAARIFAIVDVFDALSFDRPYRKAWPREKVLEYLQEQAGRHFDPDVVDAFLTLLPEKPDPGED